jgi:hypothetical protein
LWTITWKPTTLISPTLRSEDGKSILYSIANWIKHGMAGEGAIFPGMNGAYAITAALLR